MIECKLLGRGRRIRQNEFESTLHRSRIPEPVGISDPGDGPWLVDHQSTRFSPEVLRSLIIGERSLRRRRNRQEHERGGKAVNGGCSSDCVHGCSTETIGEIISKKRSWERQITRQSHFSAASRSPSAARDRDKLLSSRSRSIL